MKCPECKKEMETSSSSNKVYKCTSCDETYVKNNEGDIKKGKVVRD